MGAHDTVEHELNFRGENALIDADTPAALPNGNPHAAPLAGAIDHLRTALAQSSALIAARVSTLLDSSLTGLPPFLALHPGPESGALVVEYTLSRRCRGSIAGYPGGRADRFGVPRRRVTLEPCANRRQTGRRNPPGATGADRH